MRCPCCGGPVETMEISLATIPQLAGLTVSEQIVFEALTKKAGQRVRREAIADALYGDRPDGGPLWSYGSLACFVSKLRTKLKPFKMRVETATGGGWVLTMTAGCEPTKS